MIQSWLVNNDKMGWAPGDLVVHFAGCWVKNQCEGNWNKMWAQRGKAPPAMKKKANWTTWLTFSNQK